MTNSRMGSAMLQLLAMGALLSETGCPAPRKAFTGYIPPVDPPIPKGCKEYTFNHGDQVFKCIALNDKSAKKKFAKWQANQTPKIMILSKDNLPEWKAQLRLQMKEQYGIDNYDETIDDAEWLDRHEGETPEAAISDEVSNWD